MRRPEWYVVQVQTGREQQMCQVIERTCAEADMLSDVDGSHLLQECFSPRYRTQHKFGGEWRDVEKSLLPGYVVAVTCQPDAVARCLRKTPDFTRLLVSGETFVPLRDDERAWMEEFTRQGDRTIPMSFGYREGDSLVVTKGPLKGREGMVMRVNRKKSIAVVEIHINGKKVTTTVGLAIVAEGSGTDA